MFVKNSNATVCELKPAGKTKKAAAKIEKSRVQNKPSPDSGNRGLGYLTVVSRGH